jgi:hypothetical protein
MYTINKILCQVKPRKKDIFFVYVVELVLLQQGEKSFA